MEKGVKCTRFHGYLKKHWKIYSLFIVFIYISIPLGLLNPYLSKLLIDDAYLNQDLNLFWIIVLLMALVYIFNTLFSIIKDFMAQHIQREITFDLTKNLFNHLQTLSLKFFKDKTSGELVYKINDDVNAVSWFVFSITTQILTLISTSKG